MKDLSPMTDKVVLTALLGKTSPGDEVGTSAIYALENAGTSLDSARTSPYSTATLQAQAQTQAQAREQVLAPAPAKVTVRELLTARDFKSVHGFALVASEAAEEIPDRNRLFHTEKGSPGEGKYASDQICAASLVQFSAPKY